jgi:hypothetical protein
VRWIGYSRAKRGIFGSVRRVKVRLTGLVGGAMIFTGPSGVPEILSIHTRGEIKGVTAVRSSA